MPDTPPIRPPADPRVLVVEDETRMRELLKTVITSWGFDVLVARSSEEAWRLTADQPVDIAVLDLNLPGEGGIELLRRLRERYTKLQAIILTGFASLDAAREAIHLDVVEFLTKPCHLGELEKALDRAMRRLSPANPPKLTSLPAMSQPTDNTGKTLEEVEREHILSALARNNNNRTATAAELGISRRTLYYKLEEYQRQGHGVE